MNKRNRVVSFIVGLIVSILSIVREVNIDLSKSKQVVGKVSFADIRTVRRYSFKWRSYKLVFYFRLDNSNQKFAYQNAYEGYEHLRAGIRIGDTIKVYFMSNIHNGDNSHIFQIEKNGKILVDYDEYNRTVSSYAGLGLFLGIFLFIGNIMWYKKFNIFRFLDTLVRT